MSIGVKISQGHLKLLCFYCPLGGQKILFILPSKLHPECHSFSPSPPISSWSPAIRISHPDYSKSLQPSPSLWLSTPSLTPDTTGSVFLNQAAHSSESAPRSKETHTPKSQCLASPHLPSHVSDLICCCLPHSPHSSILSRPILELFPRSPLLGIVCNLQQLLHSLFIGFCTNVASSGDSLGFTLFLFYL